jgi:hypothetical protein
MFRIRCEPVPEKGVYRLCESVIIEGIYNPEGYEWNGASVPAPLWPIIGSPFDPRFMAPALVHDRVYETGEIPRKDADKLLRKLLIHNKVVEDLAQTMYYGVRVGGAAHYNRGNKNGR